MVETTLMSTILRAISFISGVASIALRIVEFNLSVKNSLPILHQHIDALIIAMAAVPLFAEVVIHAWHRPGPPATQPDYRQVLIDGVRKNWVIGVLREALKDAQFPIYFDVKSDYAGDARESGVARLNNLQDRLTPLQRAMNLQWRRNESSNSRISGADAVPIIFDDVDRKLLILGDPGSGKTVLLLQLANALLDQAADGSASMPVVLNLSSWALKRQPIKDWITAELKLHYAVDNETARAWINADSLIYLLDGLDEVAADYRDLCLLGINDFIAPTRQIVICSRLEEYGQLSAKLNVYNAIELQPLDECQVASVLKYYLKPNAVQTLLSSLRVDDAIWNEVNKPLFINVLINTYQAGKPVGSLPSRGTPVRSIQALIIEPFVVSQLRNNRSGEYANDDIWRYLAWLGYNLRERELTQFYVEMIQGEWLIDANQGKRSTISVRRMLRLLNADLDKKAEYTRPSFRGFSSAVRSAVKEIVPDRFEFVFLGIVGLIFLLLQKPLLALVAVWSCLLLFKMVLHVFFTHWPIRTSTIKERSTFNHGLKSALRLGLTNWLGYGVFSGSVFGFVIVCAVLFEIDSSYFDRPISLLMGHLIVDMCIWFGAGFALGSIFSTVIGFLFESVSGSWTQVIKHYILRIILYRRGFAPLRYNRFLTTAVSLRIMRQVGGSTLFVHRYILEYFADQWKQKYQNDH